MNKIVHISFVLRVSFRLQSLLCIMHTCGFSNPLAVGLYVPSPRRLEPRDSSNRILKTKNSKFL